MHILEKDHFLIVLNAEPFKVERHLLFLLCKEDKSCRKNGDFLSRQIEKVGDIYISVCNIVYILALPTVLLDLEMDVDRHNILLI